MTTGLVLVAGTANDALCDLSARLRQCGYRVAEALDTPLAAIEQRSRSADLILLLPGAGGDELETAIRLRRHHPTLGIVLIVGTSSEERAVIALRAGVADYFKSTTAPAEF